MNTIVQGDVLDELRRMPTASIDAVLSDPPYGLSFLNMPWDETLPSQEVWTELARVTKPGANVLVFGGARTFHRLAVDLEAAGFVVVDILMWLYAQGFPKSQALLKPAYEPIILARAPGRARPQPLNVDGCRIGPGHTGGTAGRGKYGRDQTRGATSFRLKSGPRGGNARGRWPADVILDEAVARQLDVSVGKRRSGAMPEGTTRAASRNYISGYHGGKVREGVPESAGGPSRFFYCPKVKGVHRAHPTQKPIELTQWLGRLLHVPNGRLLVPYAGAGSEMVGAVAGGWRHVIGIEASAHYAAIAEQRLAAMSRPAVYVVRPCRTAPRARRRVVREVRPSSIPPALASLDSGSTEQSDSPWDAVTAAFASIGLDPDHE